MLTAQYYIVYVVINILFLIYFWFYLIDTRALSLEEITMLFDYPRKEARERAAEHLQERIRLEQERAGRSSLDDDKKEVPAVQHLEKV